MNDVINRSLKRMSEEEMKQLFAEYRKTKSTTLRNELVERNLFLVVSVMNAMKVFKRQGENVEDVFQNGVIGLIKAVEGFKDSLGLKFSTYAYPMIRGYIWQDKIKDHPLKISREMVCKKNKMYKFLKTWEETHQKVPTMEEIETHLQFSTDEAICCLELLEGVVSLDQKISMEKGSGDIFVLDTVKNKEDPIGHFMFKKDLSEAVQKLEKNEKIVIESRYFQNKTQTQLADELGMTQVNVSRIEKKAMQKMKCNLQ